MDRFFHRDHAVAHWITRLIHLVLFSQGLQFALVIFRAGTAACGNCRFTQSHHAFLTVGIFRAEQAARGMFRKKHLQQFNPQSTHFRAVRVNFHALFYWRCASGGHIRPALNLDNTHATASV
jgi:hypothetical protein